MKVTQTQSKLASSKKVDFISLWTQTLEKVVFPCSGKLESRTPEPGGHPPGKSPFLPFLLLPAHCLYSLDQILHVRLKGAGIQELYHQEDASLLSFLLLPACCLYSDGCSLVSEAD